MIANTVKIEKVADLYQIFEVPIYISGRQSQGDFYKELHANSWGIVIEDACTQTIKIDDIAQFISDLIVYRSQEISVIRPKQQATLYFWFDEMALQLCCNIVSGAHRELPFSCTVNRVDTPYPILKKFVQSACNYALHGNQDEFIFFEKDDPRFSDDFEVDLSSIIVDVWQITLPWSDESSE